MATFTDLSASTQAGDPVVSTLMSGLDRNQIAALEGDSTATMFIQAQKNSFTDEAVTNPKMGDQTASLVSATGIESVDLSGGWFGQFVGGTSYPYVARRFNRAGQYRFKCRMQITNAAGRDISNAKIKLYKNPTSYGSSPGGTLLSSSASVSGVSSWTEIDFVATVGKGDLIALIGADFGHQYNPPTTFEMEYRVLADHPSVASPKTVGIAYERVVPSSGFFFFTLQLPRAKHIDWNSSPAGEMT
jgi:hypothetical protein